MPSTTTYNKRLLDGNERFRKNDTAYAGLAEAQHPKVVMLACSDSRVDPVKITDSALGELFVVRSIGGAVDQSIIASIEYPIEHLGVGELAVIGHTGCGAVTAAQKMLAAGMVGGAEQEDGSAFHRTIAGIRRGISKNSTQNIVDLEHAVIDNAIAQAQKVTESSAIVKEALAKGRLLISIWLYDIRDGRLSMVKAGSYNERSGALSFDDSAG
ncbi:MAG: carbonic anhydrase [Candidatus Marsarchaeota archaeon]|jgi:carbonic anhydrase|nr:carbonic anhydrase [Candidatus Marsarchaeota archaeon]MCL5111616.1 carbonic anhydrase [Candidatus Marsarchaeota archaeon]